MARGANQGAAKKQVAVNTDELSDDEEYNKVRGPCAMLLVHLMLLTSAITFSEKEEAARTRYQAEEEEEGMDLGIRN